MRAFHDSRDAAYRSPRGAVPCGTPVRLALDVGWTDADGPGAEDGGADGATGAARMRVMLRTWEEGVGERLHEMMPEFAATPDGGGADRGAGDTDRGCRPGGSTRFSTTIRPESAGIVWYQFVIEYADGSSKRYGVPDGRRGGAGQLYEWEPPSFQLSVLDGERGTAGRGLREAEVGNLIVSFVRGDLPAGELASHIEERCEAAPFDEVDAAPVSLGAGGKLGLIARLAGFDQLPLAADSGGVGEAPDIEEGKRGLAKGRLWCASLIQMFMPGVPETLWGTGSGNDADPLPWERDEADCLTIVENASDIGTALPLFTQGAFSCSALSRNVLALWRHTAKEAACLLVNASLAEAAGVAVPMAGPAVSEIVSGYGVDVSQSPDGTRQAHVHLHQLGSAILYFHDEARLAQPMEGGIGVLAHITSVPDAKGPSASTSPLGRIDACAHAFVDQLADAGARYWQVLPINPTDEFGSPYAGISAFAGNPLLMGDEPDDGFDRAAFEDFRAREADWLDPYACFMAIRQKVGDGLPWQEWPAEYRSYAPSLLDGAELAAGIEAQRRQQYRFARQWAELRKHANARGIAVIGDMPIYVSADSADVWANPELFQLGPDGKPSAVAGCPPDAFAEEGQIWGNPLYDWDRLEADGFAWWMRRLARAFELYDFVRLDHFIGFTRYFAIPARQKATAGTYHAGPGIRLFQEAHRRFGPLPVIAEDLGLITPAVRALGATCGFPGMDIVQFADGDDPASGYAPRPEKIAYSGTHDNRTLVGYVADRYPDRDLSKTADGLLRAVAACAAPVRVFPLQDLMGLGDEARMNTPGTSEGNWTWRADAGLMGKAMETLRALRQIPR